MADDRIAVGQIASGARPLQPVLRRCMVVSLGALALSGCTGATVNGSDVPAEHRPNHPEGRLVIPPRPPSRPDARVSPGLHRLHVGVGKGALLYVPSSYDASKPAPLAIMLHGAGSGANRGVGPFLDLADDRGIVLLAPHARGRTWDLLEGGYGRDVLLIQTLLERVLEDLSIDRRRIALEGFSDGASYALSLGITNGDVFDHIIAFSPGFAAPAASRGPPSVYITHGTEDRILPIDSTSRRIVARLRKMGLHVTYREFDSGHLVPRDLAVDALNWWLRG